MWLSGSTAPWPWPRSRHPPGERVRAGPPVDVGPEFGEAVAGLAAGDAAQLGLPRLLAGLLAAGRLQACFVERLAVAPVAAGGGSRAARRQLPTHWRVPSTRLPTARRDAARHGLAAGRRPAAAADRPRGLRIRPRRSSARNQGGAAMAYPSALTASVAGGKTWPMIESSSESTVRWPPISSRA